MTLKEKLGWGKMANEDELMSHELAKAAKPKSRFDAAISSILTNMLMQIVIPWMKYCFEKYTEQEFHDRMSAGFDFIEDWRQNHKERVGRLLSLAKKFRDRFEFDEIALYGELMRDFHRRGFVLTDGEKVKIMENILTIKQIIYSDENI